MAEAKEVPARTELSDVLKPLTELAAMKPVQSKKALLDLIFVPTSFLRRRDWEKVRQIDPNHMGVHYAQVGMFEAARLAIYGIFLYNNVPRYVEFAKQIYDKVQ